MLVFHRVPGMEKKINEIDTNPKNKLKRNTSIWLSYFFFTKEETETLFLQPNFPCMGKLHIVIQGFILFLNWEFQERNIEDLRN